MIKGWLVGVAILFVLAEFSLWLKQFILPLPIYILAGALLAIASNYEQGIVALFRQQANPNPETISQTATLINNAEAINPKDTNLSSLPDASAEDN